MSVNYFRLLGNRLLIKRAKALSTKNGVLLPNSVQKKPEQGTVVAIGPGKTSEEGSVLPMEVSTGDTVLFSSYSGMEVTREDQDYLVMSEDDILAIIQ